MADTDLRESTRRPLVAPTAGDVSRIVEMAWEDRTPFESIERQFGLGEPQVVALMRAELKRSSFVRWRKRVAGRTTKHGERRAAARLDDRCAPGSGVPPPIGSVEDPHPERRSLTDELDVPRTRRG